MSNYKFTPEQLAERQRLMALPLAERPLYLLSKGEKEKVKKWVMEWLLATELVNELEFSFTDSLVVVVNEAEWDLGKNFVEIRQKVLEVRDWLASD